MEMTSQEFMIEQLEARLEMQTDAVEECPEVRREDGSCGAYCICVRIFT
ncbi:MAG TPA: hypothetical protein VK420_09425 [Longimicrobium sp.]|jgi:hypothetical protein|nr:hypothetical protein [Longimicrobium sp.]